MGQATEHKSIVSRSARLFLYNSPVANAVLFALTFYVLSEHHSKLHQLQSLVEDSRAPQVKRDSNSNQVGQILLRSARQRSRQGARGALDKYIEGIIDWQVKKP